MRELRLPCLWAYDNGCSSHLVGFDFIAFFAKGPKSAMAFPNVDLLSGIGAAHKRGAIVRHVHVLPYITATSVGPRAPLNDWSFQWSE